MKKNFLDLVKDAEEEKILEELSKMDDISEETFIMASKEKLSEKVLKSLKGKYYKKK